MVGGAARAPYLFGMKRTVLALASIVLSAATLLGPTSAALADCADGAAPGVNWRRCLFDGRPLVDADLSGAMLRDAAFNRGRLDGANLSDSDAYRAKFVSATAKNAKFDRARLIEADFTRADLSGASFIGADLRNARLVDVNLQGGDLTDARLHGADLRQADFSGARWVDGRKICAEKSIGQCN